MKKKNSIPNNYLPFVPSEFSYLRQLFWTKIRFDLAKDSLVDSVILGTFVVASVTDTNQQRRGIPEIFH